MTKITHTEEKYLQALEDAPDGLTSEALIVLAPSRGLISRGTDYNRLAVHLGNLRKKLPPGLDLISIRGWGYRLIKTA